MMKPNRKHKILTLSRETLARLSGGLDIYADGDGLGKQTGGPPCASTTQDTIDTGP